MIDLDVQNALCAQLKTLQSNGSPVIAWPFVDFAPTAGVSYLDARPILRGPVVNPTIVFGGPYNRKGIFQVDAVVPEGQGEAPGLQLAEQVITVFAEGTQLVAGGYRLQVIRPPSIAAAVKDAPWIRFPVSVPYLIIA